MPVFTAKSTRITLPTLALFALLSGCGPKEDIRTYTVPKPVQPKLASARAPAGGGVRQLGAILPREGATWYFKFAGPASLVTQEHEAFVQFISSIRFQNVTDEEGKTVSLPRWQLPTGWQQAPGAGMRFATITVGPAAHAQELTVFRFEGDSGSIMANVERWAGLIGLTNLTPAQLADMTRTIAVDGQPATLVDMTGPGGGDSGMGPARPAGPTRPPVNPLPPVASSPPKPVYEVPQGWEPQEVKSDSMRMAGFTITEGEAKAEMTIVPLVNQDGRPADPVANFNRWREQVGLTPVSREVYGNDLQIEEAQRKYVTVIMVDGEHALFVDYTGPGGEAGAPQRIIGVMQPVGEYTLFYKLMGPAELVGKNRDAFGAFLQSIRYQEPQ